MPHRDSPRRQGRRLLLRSLLRSTLIVVLLVVIYYVAPLDRELDALTAVILVVGLLLFTLLVARQVRAITRAEHPRLRAVEALATSVPLLLILFAGAYFIIERNRPGAFSQRLDRTDSLYFTVTVFATVGFGDIVPVTSGARIVTMLQMLFDLVAVGLTARVILSAVQVGLQRRPGGSGPKDPAPPGGDGGPP
ncbi:hypothetical protein GCM10012280_15490 [Wenjunlia tyrosinilytica]|uniref:Potassium channel domain-containing protein n=1 Tax=Wenjunlia tyrosinilytica TaxID=1544741 RepID=A0A917ZL66_9ACTN|nr:hypothetical protein GCM10012280_15490 [Wenjunlia tyrosinilytica]